MDRITAMFWFGFVAGTVFASVWAITLHWLSQRKPKEPEREADFFEPVQYPSDAHIAARRAAREWIEQITVEY